MKTSHNQLVLNHLIDHGYITQTIASNYGIRRVAARILDLKNQGVTIDAVIKSDDLGVRYAYYTISENSRHFQRIRRNGGLGWQIGKRLAA